LNRFFVRTYLFAMHHSNNGKEAKVNGDIPFKSFCSLYFSLILLL
jgi:hypothetical protein